MGVTCPACGDSFKNLDELQEHERKPVSEGGHGHTPEVSDDEIKDRYPDE